MNTGGPKLVRIVSYNAATEVVGLTIHVTVSDTAFLPSDISISMVPVEISETV